MPDVMIGPLSGPDDLPTFNQLDYLLDDEYAADLDHTRRRPEWMWLALRENRVVARAAWWGQPGSATPLLMDVLDVDPAAPDRHQVAVDLVRTALQTMGLSDSPPEYGRYLPAGWRDDPEQMGIVSDRTTVIEQLGGQRLVERLRLQWGPDAPAPADRHRLTFRPPADRGELLELLTRVLEGTLDEHSRNELRTKTPSEVATDQLDEEFPSYRGPRDWWAVGCLPDGEPVGFVIPSRNNYNWIIAYIGVLPEHRGHGHIDHLLDHGTRVLDGAGAGIIKASTDCGNTPMAAAFHRCGYPTAGEELDYIFPGASYGPAEHPGHGSGYGAEWSSVGLAVGGRYSSRVIVRQLTRPRRHPTSERLPRGFLRWTVCGGWGGPPRAQDSPGGSVEWVV